MNGTGRIELHRTDYAPGETLAGRIVWDSPLRGERWELRLGWETAGKGSTDAQIVRELAMEVPRSGDDCTFEIPLPLGPYSFSGKLISLAWHLELVGPAGDPVHRLEFVLSPTGRELDLVAWGKKHGPLEE